MCQVEIFRTVFVDTFFGDDATGQLNCLDFPFQTFDAAYNAIGTNQPPYRMFLANGVYIMELDLYENITIDSMVRPVLILAEKELAWNGVIIENCDIFLPQTPSAPLRPPVRILGGSQIESSCRLSAENFALVSVTSPQNVEPFETIVERTRFLFENLSTLSILAESQITITSFQDDHSLVIGFVDNRNGDAVLVPPNLETSRTLVTAVTTDHQCLFVGNDERVRFNVSDEFLFIAIIENSEPGIRQTARFTPAPVGVVDVILGGFVRGFVSALFQAFSSSIQQIPINQNENASRVTEEVQTQLENVQATINDRTTEEVPPLLAILNSSITSETEVSLTANIIEYLYDQGNTSGVILPDIPDVNSPYPVINVQNKDGSEIQRGSEFTRYRVITENYTHDPFDGEVFLIDASEQDIQVTIPKTAWRKIWDGRRMTYKRIDHSCNEVTILIKSGRFDRKKRRIQLNTSCICKEILPSVQLIIAEQGNAYILSRN